METTAKWIDGMETTAKWIEVSEELNKRVLEGEKKFFALSVELSLEIDRVDSLTRSIRQRLEILRDDAERQIESMDAGYQPSVPDTSLLRENQEELRQRRGKADSLARIGNAMLKEES